MLESPPLIPSLASARMSLGPSAERAKRVVEATPAVRATLAPRRGNLRDCASRK